MRAGGAPTADRLRVLWMIAGAAETLKYMDGQLRFGIKPLVDAGHLVTVVFCGDIKLSASNARTWKLDLVRIADMPTQHARLLDCWSFANWHARKRSWVWDWVVRSRPDLRWFGPRTFNISSLSRQHLHMRVRCAGRDVTRAFALRRDQLSWAWEEPMRENCLSEPTIHRDVRRPVCADSE